MYVCVHAHVYVCMCTCVYTCVLAYMCIFIHICMRTDCMYPMYSIVHYIHTVVVG